MALNFKIGSAWTPSRMEEHRRDLARSADALVNQMQAAKHREANKENDMSGDRNPNEREWPTYRSHKRVRAARIMSIEIICPNHTHEPEDDQDVEIMLVPLDPHRGRIKVSEEFFIHRILPTLENHDHLLPGYYVMYEDGYDSWSPASTFEAGYDLVKDGE